MQSRAWFYFTSDSDHQVAIVKAPEKGLSDFYAFHGSKIHAALIWRALILRSNRVLVIQIVEFSYKAVFFAAFAKFQSSRNS